MKSKHIKRTIIAALLIAMTMVVFTAPGSFAFTGTTQTKATTKAPEKPKPVAINIAVVSETDAEVEIVIEKAEKKKTNPFKKTVNLKKGNNYFTYNKGTKGVYTVVINAFGDSTTQKVTAIQGSYAMLFSIAPPKDGDAKKASGIVYQDLTKIKDKK